MPKGTTFFDNFRPRVEDEDEDKVKKNLTDEEEGNLTPEEIEAKEREELERKSGDYGDDPEPKSEEKEVEDEDPFIATIDHLAEKGLLVFDPEKVYETEGEELLEEVFQETLEKRFQEEFVDSIPEEYQSIFKHLQLGKPLDEWVDAIKPLDYDKIDLTDEDNQKQLIEDHLALTGMDDEDIKETIKEYEDLGILDKKSTVALKYLKKNEDSKAKLYEKELEKQFELQERQAQEDLEDLRKDILSKDELEGFKLDKKTREKLFDHITKPVNKRGESQLVINQKSRDKQLLVAYLDMKGYKFDDIKKEVETKVTSGLRQKLSVFTDKNASRSGGKQVTEPKQSVRVPKGIWDTQREIED